MLRYLAETSIDHSLLPLARYLIRKLGMRPDTDFFVKLDAAKDSAQYFKERMSDAQRFEDRDQLLEYSLSKAKIDGHHLEFGVYRGKSINFIAARIKPKQIVGFDSFEGLAEDWSGTNELKGRFSTKGRIPRVRRNVKLISGWFNDTLPPFFDNLEGPVTFAHIDCDTYDATKTVLWTIKNHIRRGTVLQFDEYFGYPNWRMHEFRGFQEFCSKNNITYEYIGYGNLSVSVEIK